MKVIPIRRAAALREVEQQEQLYLIKPPDPVSCTRLEAPDSPKHAYYEVSIHKLNGEGYVVKKASGGRNSRPVVETWWRCDFKSAAEKYGQLLGKKLKSTTKTKGRIYKVVSVKNSENIGTN